MTRSRFLFGDFEFDAVQGRLERDGAPVAVGQRALALLHALLAADSQTITKADLMEAAWPGLVVEESNLSVQIAALRKLLGPAPSGGSWIATVPRLGYRFTGMSGSNGAVPAERTDKPVIAVLPFVNLGGDPAEDHVVDGISEDIIAALTRHRWFVVVSRNASFACKGGTTGDIVDRLGARYLLEGSVRRSGERIRISAQLAEADAGIELWAERYDLERAELFAIQDEIAERVAGAIEPELLRTEASLAVTRHTGNMTAWDLVRRGAWHFHRVGRDTHLEARTLFRQACRIDPLLPEAHIWRARVSAGLLAYGWSDDPRADAAEGLEAGLTAVRLDERDPYAHYALAIISAYADRLAQARRAAERSIEINPSFALGHLVLGMARLFGGDAKAAVPALERGLLLSPHDPQGFVWLNLLSHALLIEGRADDALQAALKSLTIRPNWRPSLEIAACCHAALDHADAARDMVRDMIAAPATEGDVLAPLRVGMPAWEERRAALVKSAGAGE